MYIKYILSIYVPMFDIIYYILLYIKLCICKNNKLFCIMYIDWLTSIVYDINMYKNLNIIQIYRHLLDLTKTNAKVIFHLYWKYVYTESRDILNTDFQNPGEIFNLFKKFKEIAPSVRVQDKAE